MINHSEKFSFPVRRYGSAASQLLAAGLMGKVAAVFKSSFYIETKTGFACIGNEELYASPLNISTDAPGTMNWSACGLRLNDSFEISLDVIRIGNRFVFPLTGSQNWSHDTRPFAWNISDLRRGLSSFYQEAQVFLPAEGLSGFILDNRSARLHTPICQTAKRSIDKLRGWLFNVFQNPEEIPSVELEEIQTLIGLGPGLTPSGDDFLGGMMIALHDLGEAETASFLWQVIGRSIKEKSNPISYAHIKSASMGEASEGIHHLTSSILKGSTSPIKNSLQEIEKIGHTSGWDCMAGIILTLECWCRAKSVA